MFQDSYSKDYTRPDPTIPGVYVLTLVILVSHTFEIVTLHLHLVLLPYFINHIHSSSISISTVAPITISLLAFWIFSILLILTTKGFIQVSTAFSSILVKMIKCQGNKLVELWVFFFCFKIQCLLEISEKVRVLTQYLIFRPLELEHPTSFYYM